MLALVAAVLSSVWLAPPPALGQAGPAGTPVPASRQPSGRERLAPLITSETIRGVRMANPAPAPAAGEGVGGPPRVLAPSDIVDGRNQRFGLAFTGPGSGTADYVTKVMGLTGSGTFYDYDRLDTFGTPLEVELITANDDLTAVAARARARPGTAWMLANEPNVVVANDPTAIQTSAKAYSDFLKRASDAIKAADSTAILIGPNLLNWQDTCVACPGFAKGQDWANAFLGDYQTRYGALPLHVWGVHTYSVDWSNQRQFDPEFDKAQITGARQWLDQRSLNLPIWLTEFGVIWGYDSYVWEEQTGTPACRTPQTQNGKLYCLTPGTAQYRTDLVLNYLEGLLTWLSANTSTMRIERWFLYSDNPGPESYASVNGGIATIQLAPQGPALTALGDRFRQKATYTFYDVPNTFWAYTQIDQIYQKRITTGCTGSGEFPLRYCPGNVVNRDQMATFLVRAKYGPTYTPPPATGIFADVPKDYWAAPWIEKALADGITTGCDSLPNPPVRHYCPSDRLNRDQMAVFLVRTKRGNSFTPPPATGQFADVPKAHWAAGYIEQALADGITTGCVPNSDPAKRFYCPLDPVTRDQMAVFLNRTFP